MNHRRMCGRAPHRLRSIAAMLAVVSMALAATGCNNGPATETKDTTATAVTIGAENFAIVAQGQIQTGPSISGTLQPSRLATMRAQIAGAVLMAGAEQGQRVGRGTLLVRLDDRSIRDIVAGAQAGVDNAQSNLALAKRELKRLEELYEVGAISQRDVDNAQRNVVSADAAIAQARSQLSAARKQQAYTEVRSPLSGVVSQKLVSTGDIVQPGTALYTVVDPASMELAASIPADQISLVKVGTQIQFNVSGYNDRSFNGAITRISPTADPATRQVKVFAEIPNSAGSLLGDLFAEGRVATESRSTLVVPSAAIDRRMTKPAVMKLSGGKVQRVEVAIGISDEQTDRVEIVSGAMARDTVLIGPALQIAEGTRIRIARPAKQSTPSTALEPRRTP